MLRAYNATSSVTTRPALLSRLGAASTRSFTPSSTRYYSIKHLSVNPNSQPRLSGFQNGLMRANGRYLLQSTAPSQTRNYWWSSKPQPPPTQPVPATTDAPDTTATSSLAVESTTPSASTAPTTNSLESTSTATDVLPQSVDQVTSAPLQAIDEVAASGVSDPIIHHFGDFAAQGVGSFWTPAGWWANALDLVHATTGAPWWLSIIITSVALRALLLPLILKANRAMDEVKPISKELNLVIEECERCEKENDQLGKMLAQQKRMELSKVVMSSAGASLKNAAATVVFNLGAFLGSRNVSKLPDTPFKTGGTLWFQDLTVPDWTLTGIAIPSIAWFVRRSAADGAEPAGKGLAYHMPNVMPFVSAAFTLGMAWFASAQVLVVIVNSIIMAIQSSLLRNNRVRAYLKMSPYESRTVPSYSETWDWVKGNTASEKKKSPTFTSLPLDQVNANIKRTRSRR